MAKYTNFPNGIKSESRDVNFQYLISRIVDISTAGTIYVPMPACSVTKITTVIDGAIITADAVITPKNNAGTAMTGGAITIATAGSAAGDTDTSSPTANNTFLANEVMQIATNGASGNVVVAQVILQVKITDTESE